jgi:hypothetical protein
VFALPDTSLARRLAGMAVRTKDLALRDLLDDGRPSETCPAHVCDVVALVTQVVELEDDRIALAALHAGVLRQVLPRAQLILVGRLIASHSNMRDVFVAIALIPKAFVFNEAGLAPRVANAELGISETELIEGLFHAAFTAGFGFERLHRTCILSRRLARNNHIRTGIRTAIRDSSVRNRLCASPRNQGIRYFSHLTPCFQLSDPAFLSPGDNASVLTARCVDWSLAGVAAHRI